MVNKLDEFEKPAGWGPALLEVFVPIGKWDYDKAVKAWGTKWDVEYHVLSGIGKDHTLFALIDGTVTFKKKTNAKSFVSVEPLKEVE
jgi:hypothetical protein